MTASPWQYFTIEELTCHCGCGKMDMDEGFMRKIVSLRRSLGFPFPVSSGFRCPEHNNNVSGSGLNGPHTTGHAMDIEIAGEEALDIISNATDFHMTGVGIKQHGDKRFIHLDDLKGGPTRPRPWVWSY